MGIAHRSDPAAGCTTSVWDGSLDAHDVRQHLIRLAEDRAWPPGPLHLTDLTTMTGASIPNPELLDLLYEGTNLPEELNVAVVVQPEFLRKPTLQFASATRAMHATVFTDLDLACTHLGISAATARTTISELRDELRQR